MSFEDELADIVRNQKVKKADGSYEPTLSEDLAQEIAQVFKNKKTFGYIVYILDDPEHTRQGLIPLGAYKEKSLSHSHRVADHLIDMLLFSEMEEDEE
jgi:hypothetical protein